MRLFTSSFVVAAALAVAMPAAAQMPQGPRSERPYRGLFAGGTGNARELLTLSGSFGGGYDDNIFASGAGAPAQSSTGGSTSFLTGSGQLGYSLSKSKLSFSANGGAGIGHYPGLGEPTIVHYAAGVGVSAQVARHSSVSFTQQETYQPFYFWSWLPSDIVPVETLPVFDPGTMTLGDAVQAVSLTQRRPIVADAVAGQEAEYYLSSETGVGYNQGLTQHLSLSLGYSYRRSDSSSHQRDYQTSSASGRLSYALSKDVSMFGGFSYGKTEYPNVIGPSSNYDGRNIDGGVNYNKALSFSRRTTLGFSTGLAGVNDGIQTHYNVVGNVQLTREIGRDWNAGVGYSRNVSYVETFRAPVLYDALFASIGGLVNRATQFSAAAGASRGDVGYTSNNSYETYFASAGARFAISRRAGLSVYYGYYRYSMDNGIVLPPGVSNFSNRQSVGFSFDTWVPLIQRNRSAS